MAPTGSVVEWKVLGRAIVRDGPKLESSELGHLVAGAVVSVDVFSGDRVCYTKLSGDGPATGWIVSVVNGRSLLQRLQPVLAVTPDPKSEHVPLVTTAPTGPVATVGEEADSPTVAPVPTEEPEPQAKHISETQMERKSNKDDMPRKSAALPLLNTMEENLAELDRVMEVLNQKADCSNTPNILVAPLLEKMREIKYELFDAYFEANENRYGSKLCESEAKELRVCETAVFKLVAQVVALVMGDSEPWSRPPAMRRLRQIEAMLGEKSYEYSHCVRRLFRYSQEELFTRIQTSNFLESVSAPNRSPAAAAMTQDDYRPVGNDTPGEAADSAIRRQTGGIGFTGLTHIIETTGSTGTSMCDIFGQKAHAAQTIHRFAQCLD